MKYYKTSIWKRPCIQFIYTLKKNSYKSMFKRKSSNKRMGKKFKHFPKEELWMANKSMKQAQPHWSSCKCKLNHFQIPEQNFLNVRVTKIDNPKCRWPELSGAEEYIYNILDSSWLWISRQRRELLCWLGWWILTSHTKIWTQIFILGWCERNCSLKG